MRPSDLIVTKNDVETILRQQIVIDFFVMYNGLGPNDIKGISYRNSFLHTNKLLVYKAFFVPSSVTTGIPADQYNEARKDPGMLQHIMDVTKDFDTIVMRAYNVTAKQMMGFRGIPSMEKLKFYFLNSSYALRFDTLTHHFHEKEDDALFLLMHILDASIKYWTTPEQQTPSVSEEAPKNSTTVQ